MDSLSEAKWREYLRKEYAIWLFVGVVALLNILYNQTLPLYTDEAYYWLWSIHLQLGYFDHPPFIAYLNYAFTFIFGDTVFAVRTASIFCLVVGAIYIYRVTLEVFRDRVIGEIAVFIYMIIPVIELGFSIATIDSPLAMFWSMALFYSLRAIKYDRWGDFLLAGASIGFALLSKYTGVLLLGSLGLYFLLKCPKRFLGLKPWVAIGVAIIVFSPVIIWNFQNSFISFSFQYTHGSSSSFTILWDKFFEFFGGQFLLISPIFGVASIVMLFRKKEWFRDNDRLFLLINFLFPILFFLYKALFKKMELNWAAPAFLSLLPLLGAYLYEARARKTLIAGSILSIVIVLAMKFPLLFGLKNEKNFQDRIFGPAELAQVVERHRKSGDAIMTYHFVVGSVLTFYLQNNPPVFVPFPSRYSEFDSWYKDIDYSNIEGLYIDREDVNEVLKQRFKSVELVEKVELQKEGFRPKSYYIYRVSRRK